MGSILSFVPRRAASGQNRQRPRLAASIIIFPGVRYERRALIDATGVTRGIGDSSGRQKEPAPIR